MSLPEGANPPQPPPSPKALDLLADALDGLKALESYPAPRPGEERTFGRFRLRQVLGQGRFGIVFLADDPEAGRPVALKLPQPGVLLDPALAERFRRDVEAVAHLDHPGIVPVLETGSVLGVAYIVMPYAAGPTLAAWHRRHPEGAAVAEAVDVAIALADAVEHAHERGVLHCDLKPANVLMFHREPSVSVAPALAEGFPLGEFVPRITDFGLARLLFRPDAATRTHLTAGTPPYMAPEQAKGVRRDLTARCDVHALAAILYALLTGQPPYAGNDAERMRQLLDTDIQPVRPRSLRREVPRDLEAIVLKGLEKDPANRYASARALADDLRRFREGRPTRARPVGTLGRAARWARRRPGIALLTATCLAVTAVAVGLSVRLGYQALLHRQQLDQQEFYAVLEGVRLRRQEQPDGWADANLRELRHLATLAPARDSQEALCSEAAVALAAPRLRLVQELGVGKNAYVCAFSPDGEMLALGERYPVLKSDELRVWLVRTTGEDAGELRYPLDRVWERRNGDQRADGTRALAYSPDGRWLVLGTRGGRLVRWDLREKAPRAVAWEGHVGDGEDQRGDEVRSLLFSRDGTVLVSGSGFHGRHVRRWDVRDRWKGLDRTPVLLPVGTTQVRESIWVQRRGTTAFVLEKLDLRTGRLSPVRETPGFDPFCQSIDGGRLVANTNNLMGFNPWLVCADEPSEQRPLASPARPDEHVHVTDLTLAPSGRWVWSSSEGDRRLHLWDTVRRTLAARTQLRGGSLRPAGHPGGRQVAVCEEGRTLLFELEDSGVCTTLAEGGEVRSFALSADGGRLVTARHPVGFFTPLTVYRRDRDGFVWTHHARPWSQGRALIPVALDSKGLWPLPPVHTHHDGVFGISTLEGRMITTGVLHDLQFDPEGRVWAANQQGELLLWSGKTSARVVSAVSPEAARAGASFLVIRTGPTGTLAGRRDGKVEWFDNQARRLASWDVFDDEEVSSLAMNADGSEALVGGSKGGVARLPLSSGEIIRPGEPLHTDAVVGLAYLGRGITLTASADRSIRLWDSQGQPLLVLREGDPISRAEASPEGGELYVLVRGEWGLRVWDLAALGERLRELGLAPGFAVPKVTHPPTPQPRGLLAELHDSPAFIAVVERRHDSQVNFDWALGSASYVGKLDHFSIRWTGRLRAAKPGDWEFQLDCDDHATLWIDGRVVFQDANFNEAAVATVTLPGRPVSFRLDYVENTGPARCRLLWRPAGSKEPFVPVPPEAFTPD